MTRILITGANGFIGNALCVELSGKEFEIIGCARSELPVGDQSLFTRRVSHVISADTDWRDVLREIDVVVHLAAMAHLKISNAPALAELTQVNVAATLNLAQQAAEVGIKRFVFISSIKVNGETTLPGRAFTADDEPAPKDPYAVTKYQAEQGLRRIAETSAMDYVIIRPPLVYGPGVKANFLSLIRYVQRGLPLPFAKVSNRRSLVALANLVDLIAICVKHPAAAKQTFLVSDGHDFSTPELIKNIALVLGVKSNLLPVPEAWLATGLRFSGRQRLYDRLCANLQVDMTKTQELLAWTPPVQPFPALQQTVAYFLRL